MIWRWIMCRIVGDHAYELEGGRVCKHCNRLCDDPVAWW